MFTPRRVILKILCFCILINFDGLALNHSLFESRLLHKPKSIDHKNLFLVSDWLNDFRVLNKTLQNILIPRVVGTQSHSRVQNYIINAFSMLDWHVELDSFTSDTPIGKLPFKNIIASHNPKAKRFLDIACHYDSKYYPGKNNFVGATDSAVPCAMMIQMAHSLNDALGIQKNDELSLRFIFFDGEEAFQSWSKTDSLYGARHLANKWKRMAYHEGGPSATQLDRIDMLVLLDLLGAKSPEFYSFFSNTHKYYTMLANAESKLQDKKLLNGYTKRYFLRKSTDAYIEDDHIPFLENNVPVLHIISVPFPPHWHTPRDNHSAIDLLTTKNLVKILTVFTAEYLQLLF